MENSTWEEKIQATTHILTAPSIAPPLHSQLFISAQIPCYRNWDYPPLLPCPRSASAHSTPPDHWKWALGYLFLKKAPTFGIPETSWRSKCPYFQPPPLILADGVDEAGWGDDYKREYVRKRRLHRKRAKGIKVNPLIPVLLPNLLLLSTLLWNPYPQYD